MAHTLKQSNRHAPHPTHCESCGRALPKRTTQTGHVGQCATCRKHAQFMAETQEQWRALILNAGAQEATL